MRFCNPSDVQHELATDAISRLLMQSDECLPVTQVIIEFWVVATRPTNVILPLLVLISRISCL
jgi:hypothetical protein